MKNYLLGFIFLINMVTYAQRTSFDNDWKFIQKDAKEAQKVAYDDSKWRTLDLPHDWSIEGEYKEDYPMGDRGGYLPAGIGWYRKTVPVSRDWKGKHVEIAFDGIYRNSTVWANGKELGTRPYGWISFSYDISDVVKDSDSITFSVRVDNSQQPAARWYTGSGIYAHTWLDVRDPIHVPTNGVFVRTQEDKITVDVEMVNGTEKSKKVKLRTSVLDAKGQVVVKVENKVALTVGENNPTTQSFEIPNAKRWSVEDPNLYVLVNEIVDGSKVLDRKETRFGVRDVEWKPKTGVWINGKNVKLRGVSNHQDAGALGAAVPDKILRFRIEQLKKMGVNAIRTAHNPQTPIFYELCDEIGMLVMDEVFDGWREKALHDYGAENFDKWWKRDLTDWIKRDRNHPSVIIYSMGNETRGEVGKDLVTQTHLIDATRPVTSGHAASENMDVLGVNGTSEKKGWFDTLPTDRVFVATENTHTWQVRGFYRTKTWYRDGYPNNRQKPHYIPDLTEREVFTNDWIKDNDRKNSKQIFNSSYDNATVRLSSRQNIAQIKNIANYAGSFRWTGHDYIGEAGYVHGGWPFKAFMGGAIDMANFEKDLYYLYQSQWTADPMVHILPHWTHPMVKEGTEIPVWVYSNCESVELFFNGKSLGKKKPGKKWDKMQFEWMVPWHPGALKAVGYRDGKIISQQLVRTADAPEKIKLSIDGAPLAPSGKDIVQVRVTTQDQKGEFYPYGENRTFFHIMGPGKIQALDNGSPIDVEKHYEATDRIAFYGLTRGYVKTTGKPGSITLLASTILGEKKQITSNKVSIDVQQINLRGYLPKVTTKVYYTLDGSKPFHTSTPYKGAFSVPLGTTVKAVVIVNEKPIQYLHERFAQDEGFVWNTVTGKAPSLGSQAENARFKGARIASQGENYNGIGYLDFKGVQNGYVEWYEENDGGEGTRELEIRYSGKASNKSRNQMKLIVNGKTIDDALDFPDTADWGTDWKTVKITISIDRGANTIRLSALGNGVYVDEILVK